MVCLKIFHKWKYLDNEHRICEKCGDCEILELGVDTEGFREWKWHPANPCPSADPRSPLSILLEHKKGRDEGSIVYHDEKKERQKNKEDAKKYAKNL